jgi:predicted nucleic acid-binding protein
LTAFSVQFGRSSVRSKFSSLKVVEPGGERIAIQAAIDTIVATRCIEDGIDLLHNDRDFDPFAKHLGLKLPVE